MKRAPGAIGFLFVCLFWNGIVGVFDFVLLRGAYMERRARTTFESVEATVLSSRVSSSTSDGSTTYRPNVRYRYTVAGQDFESDRISYSVFGSSDRDYAYGTVDDYPVGAQVEALVDPANPSEAVLDASGAHLPSGVLLFLTPFHCIGFGILLGLLKALRRRRTDGEERRARFVRVENERHVVIGRPLASAMAVFLVALGATSFVAIFPVVFTVGFHGPLVVTLGAFGVCAAVAGTLAFKRARKLKDPENYLHIDRRIGVFAYPADAPGERLEDVVSIAVRSKPTNVTINDVKQFDHVPEITTRSGLVRLFEFRGGEGDGAYVEEMLQDELRAA
ncbi:MAG: DUF3592 domain-containing protein [Planctomycetota bacterium]